MRHALSNKAQLYGNHTVWRSLRTQVGSNNHSLLYASSQTFSSSSLRPDELKTKRSSPKTSDSVEFVSLRKLLQRQGQGKDVLQDEGRLSKPKEYLVLRQGAPTQHRELSKNGANEVDSSSLKPEQESPDDSFDQIYSRVLEEGNQTHQADDEYLDNLRTIRSRMTSETLSQSQWDALYTKLDKGFVLEQLVSYMRIEAESQKNDGSSSVTLSPASTSIIQRSPWMIGTTAFTIELRNKNFKTSRRSQKTIKRELINKLLKDYWLLEREDAGNVGELDLLMPPAILKLLSTNHDLTELARRFDARIKLAVEGGRIRIISQRLTSELLFRELDRLASTASTMTVDVHKLIRVLWSDPAVDIGVSAALLARVEQDGLLQIIMKSTGTCIETTTAEGQATRLQIYHIGPSKAMAEEARRQVINAIGIKRDYHGPVYVMRKTQPLGFVRLQNIAGTTPLTAVGPFPDHPARLRKLPWLRLASNAEKDKEAVASVPKKDGKLFGRKSTNKLTAHLDALIPPVAEDTAQQSIWYSTCQDSIALGQLLFHLEDVKNGGEILAEPKGKEQPPPSKKPIQRAFSGMVPGLIASIDDLNVSSPLRREVVIQCIPDPWKDLPQALLNKLPRLELRIRLQIKGQKGAFEQTARLTALVREHHTSIAIPYLQSDLHLARQVQFEVHNAQDIPSIQDFLSQSLLSVKGRKKLATPPSFELELPRIMLDTFGISEERGLTEEKSQVPYLVAGMELEESFNFEHQGTKTFEFVQREGGLFGGRGASVSLHGSPGEPNYSLSKLIEAGHSLISGIELEKL